MARFKKLKNLFADKARIDRNDQVVTKAKEVEWGTWFDGMPVVPEFAEFLTELSRSMPHVKFYPHDMYRETRYVPITTADHVPGTENKSFYLVDEFLVYVDEYPFELGRVNYRNNSASPSSSARTYGVYSRKIDNAKYAPHRDQRSMVMSTDVKKAIKACRTYLVPYTHSEMATVLYKRVQEKIESTAQEAENKVWKLANSIGRTDMVAEIQNLVAQGVTFKTEAFNLVASEITGLMADAKEEKARHVCAAFVRVRTTDGFTYVDVQEAKDVRKNYSRPIFTEQLTTYPMDELPEDIAGAISVLSILEDMQYVARVGQKVDDTTYWIERG